jgi:hypothetical protein
MTPPPTTDIDSVDEECEKHCDELEPDSICVQNLKFWWRERLFFLLIFSVGFILLPITAYFFVTYFDNSHVVLFVFSFNLAIVVFISCLMCIVSLICIFIRNKYKSFKTDEEINCIEKA